VDDEVVTGWAVAAQRGDREAAAAFIRATTPQLHRLMSYLGDPGEVEDLVQETYLRAFAALSRYAQRSPARLWLWSIARRVAADQIRRKRRGPRLSAQDWQQVLDTRRTVPAPATTVEIRTAIAALEPDRREAFVLTRVAGLSYGEAAAVCQCPIGTIRSRVYRARLDLLAALDEHHNSAYGLGS